MSASIVTPAIGCWRTSAHSTSVSLPGLFSTSAGTMSLPTSCSSAPMRNQKSDGLIESRLRRQRAAEVRDALAMPLRVHVLRLDRLAPPAHDVEEVPLEARHAAPHVVELVARAQLREAGVRPVERLQRLAVAPETAIELGQLAVGVALHGEVAHLRAHLPGALEMRLGGRPDRPSRAR